MAFSLTSATDPVPEIRMDGLAMVAVRFEIRASSNDHKCMQTGGVAFEA